MVEQWATLRNHSDDKRSDSNLFLERNSRHLFWDNAHAFTSTHTHIYTAILGLGTRQRDGHVWLLTVAHVHVGDLGCEVIALMSEVHIESESSPGTSVRLCALC